MNFGKASMNPTFTHSVEGCEGQVTGYSALLSGVTTEAPGAWLIDNYIRNPKFVANPIWARPPEIAQAGPVQNCPMQPKFDQVCHKFLFSSIHPA